MGMGDGRWGKKLKIKSYGMGMGMATQLRLISIYAFRGT